MSISEERELVLSQLADGELPADQASEVLLEVLGDEEAQERLKAMIRLRQSLAPWRRQEPRRPVVAAHRVGGGPRSRRRLASLAAAAVLGGILVGGGVYVGGRLGGERPEDSTVRPRPDQLPVMIVTPEQRHEIARAFALHESVAGPLSWYAADDLNIQMTEASKEETLQQPIAIVLRLAPAQTGKGGEGKTYVIVCRNGDAAAIELPQPAAAGTVHLRLLSTAADGGVQLRYVIAADGTGRRPDEAALTGRRQVGLSQTPLGQLALNDRLVNVDASAWVIRDERKP